MEQVGPYVVESEIGRGGAGVVLRCRAPDGRVVAVKLLLDPGKNALLSRFARERALLHELAEEGGFVPLLDAGESPRGPYLVMPFVEGGTLRARLAGERLTQEQTLELMGDLAAAIGRAHARGIVHRDLKPENVLFTRDGAPLIADLGLAKHFADTSPGASASLSRTGEMRGTVGYMAPEQLRNAKQVGPPADVFSLGAIFHECLTRQPAFVGDSAMQVMASVLSGARESVRSLAPDVSPWVSDLVERALAPEEADRFRDGAELAAAIERGLREGGGRRHGVRGAVLGALALVGLALVGLVGSSWLRREDAPTPTRAQPTQTPPDGSISATVAAVPSLVVVGRLGSTWLRHSWTPTALATGPGPAHGSEVVYVGDSEGIIYVWRLPECEEFSSFEAFPTDREPIRAILPVHGAGATGIVVVGSRRGMVFARPEDAGLFNLRGHTTRVVAAATAWRTPLLATVDETGIVYVIDLARGQEVTRIDGSGLPPTALAFFPDDTTLLVGMSSGEVVPVRLDPLEVLPRLGSFKPPLRALAVSPEGDRIAGALVDAAGFVLDLGTSKLATLENVGSASVLAFARGGTLYGVVDDGAAFAANVARGTADRRGGAGIETPGLAVLADGRALVLTSPLGQPRLFGGARDEGHEGVVTALLPLPGRRLASAGADHTVRLWDLATGRELACAREHDEAVISLAPEAEGWFLSASIDGVVHSRAVATAVPQSRRVVPSRPERVRATANGDAWAATHAGLLPVDDGAAPAGSSSGVVELATVDDDLLTWDREHLLTRLEPRSGSTRWRRLLTRPSARCAIALVSATRAAVAHEAAVVLIDLATGEDAWPAPLAIDSLGRLAASPDGRFLALLQTDAVVLVSAATGEVLSRLVVTGSGDAPRAVAFAEDELFVGLARGPIVRLTYLSGPVGSRQSSASNIGR